MTTIAPTQAEFTMATRRNHFNPAAIIGAFGCPSGGREAVVRWVQKGDSRIRNATAEHVFFENDLYSIPCFDEPWKTGLLVMSWREFGGYKLDVDLDENNLKSGLAKLADEYSVDGVLNADVVERILAQQLDGPFAAVAAGLRAGTAPSDADLEICRKFLSIAYFRNPAWLGSPVNIAMRRDAVARSQRQLTEGGEAAADVWGEEIIQAQTEILQRSASLMALAQRVRLPPLISANDFAIELLIAPATLGFVLGDNPARTYNVRDNPLAPSRRAVGMEDPNSAITYPIGARHCLCVRRASTGPRFLTRVLGATETRRINTFQLAMAVRQVVFPMDADDVFLPGVSVAASPRWVEQ